jgi:hypothetical protein
MQKLKESGWVVLTIKGIEIADVAQLEKSLGEEI